MSAFLRSCFSVAVLTVIAQAQSIPTAIGMGVGGPAAPASASTSTLTALPPLSLSDDCATPTSFSGTGIFYLTWPAATTGAQPPGCSTPSTDIALDVWMTWIAPASGPVVWSFSGLNLPATDTKIAVFDGNTCPSSAPLACDDNALGTLSELRWTAVAGQAYVFQLGKPSASTGGFIPFVFSLDFESSNDECNAALPIIGSGPFDVRPLTATKSSQAQLVADCGYPSQPGMERDQWFLWTPSPNFGRAHLAQRLGGWSRLKFAVYPATGCPTQAPIACSDLSCNQVATLDWTTPANATYLIQVGIPAGATFGPDSLLPSAFTISTGGDSLGCSLGDGTSETAFGLVAGGTTGWMRAFGQTGSDVTVGAIYTTWGSGAWPYLGPSDGTPAHGLIWEDPNDDGDPSDAVLLADIPTTVNNVDTDLLEWIDLGAGVPVHGAYFAGAAVTHSAGARPAGWDVCTSGEESKCWIFGQIGGPANFSALGSNNVAPIRMSTLIGSGTFLVNACDAAPAPGVALCTGDGLDPLVTTPCPCGNFGAPGRGCGHSLNPIGARLDADGSRALDTVVLHGSGMPASSTAVYLKGNAWVVAGSTFGDGLSCVGGTLIRLRGKTNVGGASAFPDAVETITLSARGGNTPGTGQMAMYAVYYRNAASFCTPATWNVSNGYQIYW